MFEADQSLIYQDRMSFEEKSIGFPLVDKDQGSLIQTFTSLEKINIPINVVTESNENYSLRLAAKVRAGDLGLVPPGMLLDGQIGLFWTMPRQEWGDKYQDWLPETVAVSSAKVVWLKNQLFKKSMAFKINQFQGLNPIRIIYGSSDDNLAFKEWLRTDFGIDWIKHHPNDDQYLGFNKEKKSLGRLMAKHTGKLDWIETLTNTQEQLAFWLRENQNKYRHLNQVIIEMSLDSRNNSGQNSLERVRNYASGHGYKQVESEIEAFSKPLASVKPNYRLQSLLSQGLK